MSHTIEIDFEARQRVLFDSLADDYLAHYDDKTSRAFRDRFIHPALFNEVPLKGARVLDAMCGAGETTRFLLDQGAHVDGLDVSGACIERYRKLWPRCRGYAESMLDSKLPDASYDVIAIVGGLHHLHPHVGSAMNEIYRLLKPGGYLCFLEPHTGSLADIARRAWYRRDAMFEENEAAVDLDKLCTDNADRFDCLSRHYLGNAAYLLILQSMIFRVPLWLKRIYAPPLMAYERAISPLLGKRTSCVAISQWRKRNDVSTG